MTGLSMDDPRFDDLTGAGDDLIEVARVLASARLEAPARLAGVRWEAVAESGATVASAVVTTAVPPRGGRREERRTVAKPRRWRGREGGRATRLAMAVVAVAVVAALWVWVLPQLTPTAVQDRRGPRGHVPAGPTVGAWETVDQVGGVADAIARDGWLLIAGRGQHLEAYDMTEIDAEGRPRLLAVSALLPFSPRSIDVAGDRAVVAFSGADELRVYDLHRSSGLAGSLGRTVTLASWQALATADAQIDQVQIERIGRVETVYGISSWRSGDISVWRRSGRPSAPFLPVPVGEGWSLGQGANAFAVSRGHVFVGHASGLTILDATDPQDGPKIVGRILKVHNVGAIKVVGARLYVAAEAGPHGEQGIAAFDVSRPALPRGIGFVDFGLGIGSSNVIAFAAAEGRMAAVYERYEAPRDSAMRLAIFDIRDIGRPRLAQYRDMAAFSTSGLLLDGGQLVLTRSDELHGRSVDVIDIDAEEWIRPDTAPPATLPPLRTPRLASPAFQALSKWNGGLLLLSDRAVIGARFDWAPTSLSAAYGVRAGSAAPAYAAKLLTSTGWRVPNVPSTVYDVVAQSAADDRAAAVIVRSGPERRVDVGLVAWTGDDDPSDWPTSADFLDRRVKWMPMAELLGPQANLVQDVSDRSAWALTVGPRFAVVKYGALGSAKLVIYDLAAPAGGPTIVDAGDVLPPIFAGDHGAVVGMAVRGDLLFAFSDWRIATVRILPGGRLETRMHPVPAVAAPAGWWIRRIVAADRGLLIVRQEDVQFWPYDAAGVPNPDRARFVGSAADVYPSDAEVIDVAVEGDGAFISGVTMRKPRVTFIREIDLATGRIGQLIEIPRVLVSNYRIAAAQGRLFLYNPVLGVTVLERQVSVAAPARAPNVKTP